MILVTGVAVGVGFSRVRHLVRERYGRVVGADLLTYGVVRSLSVRRFPRDSSRSSTGRRRESMLRGCPGWPKVLLTEAHRC